MEEGIPIRHYQIIAETLLQCSNYSDDIVTLVGEVRIGLSRFIHQELFSEQCDIQIVALDHELDAALLEITTSPKPTPPWIDSKHERRLREALLETFECITDDDQQCVLVVSVELRYWMERFTRKFLPRVHVLPLKKFPVDYEITISETIGGVKSR